MRRGCGVIAGLLLTSATSGCDRGDAMRQEIARSMEEKEKAEVVELEPSHPLRDELAPVLRHLYANEALPRVIEADIDMEGGYQLEPGVAAVVRFKRGMPRDEQIKAVLTGVAEADAWVFRPEARRTYADLIHRVKRGHGDEAKEQVLKNYAHLRLLAFFSSKEADAAIAELPADKRESVAAMQKHYVENRDKLWSDWLAIKMYARREVAPHEPFLGLLRNISRQLGHKEAEPVAWEQSFDGPLRGWSEQIRNDEQLLIRLTNLKEMRDREAYLAETHARWVIQGSSMAPAEVANVSIDRELGFGVHSEDLGGGYKELVFVFPKGSSGASLKTAFVRSLLYASLLRDNQLLSAAGSDFAVRDADNRVDMKTAIVPDKYDTLYARCGAGPAADLLIGYYGNDHGFLRGLRGSKNSDAALKKAHRCVVDGAKPDIYIPDPSNKADVEGPAPGSKTGLFQMLSRFEKIDVDIARMQSKSTAEDLAIKELEAEIKALEQQKKGG